MPLECALLQSRSSLIDTKNRLLQEAESEYERKYSTGAFKRKRVLTTSFPLRNENLTVNRFLTKQNVKNKFLEKDVPLDISEFRDICKMYDEDEECTKKAKKKKTLAASEGMQVGKRLTELDYHLPGFTESIEEQMDIICADMDMICADMGNYSESSDFSLETCIRPLCPSTFGSSSAAVAYFASPIKQWRGLSTNHQQLSRKICQGSEHPISYTLKEMPAYYFPPLPSKKPDELNYRSLEDDSQFLFASQLKERKRKKIRFLNAVSTSLLYSPRFKKADDPFRDYLLQCVEDVIPFDPEFILKVALYARQELNIRSTANFLLAFSAHENSCKPYLKKYFESSICLPTDWIDVAEMYDVFNLDFLHRTLPAALRKVMKSSFTKFDSYQLAKYNRKKSKKTKKNEDGGQGGSGDTEMKGSVKKSFTLKQLIRMLHITSPVEEVLCLLGKKYPDDPESFRQQGLPGMWDSAKAGKRMKLPTPETWETAVSAKGNKAEVWESLIDSRKLPYMAMLRNLRNLIMAGISRQHHEKVQAQLSKQRAVIKSRQFPLRFYAAFKVLEDIKKMCTKKESATYCPVPAWKMRQNKALLKKIENIDIDMLEKYKESLSKALEISANHNLDPIGGRTLVVSDLTDNASPASGGAADYFTMKLDSCILLSLMCLKACEECEVKAVLGKNCTESVVSVELKGTSFLENMSVLCNKYVDLDGGTDKEPQEILCKHLPGLLEHYLKTCTLKYLKLDNVILLKTSCSFEEKAEKIMSSFLYKYRQLVNPNLLYIQVDLSVDTARFEDLPTSSDENNIYLAGFSEHIFKFIAERSNGGQLAYVNSIDEKYNLTKKQDSTGGGDPLQSNLLTYSQKIPLYSRVPKWKTARIFISSTFKDMHGERDVLLRYVFPELKARAATLFVKINEIDLRWGISEANTASNKSQQLCLLEAQNSDFFIGILGERYGTRCQFDEDIDPSLEWIKSYPESSITELEILCGALNRAHSREKAFFYFRDDSFLRRVPQEWRRFFEPEDNDSEERLSNLKDKIRRSGIEVFDGYPCHFAGVCNENPLVAGLDSFGQRVLNNLWIAVSKFYKKEGDDELQEDITCHAKLASSFSYFIGEQNSPFNWIMKELKKSSGIFFVTGKPGCGKTTFIVRVLKELTNNLVVPFFIGASSQSADLSYMLCYIGNSILSKLPLDIPVPISKEGLLNNFPDIIIEGSKAAFPGTLLLIVDGLDYLDVEAQKLDWLPYNLPQGFKLICSASDSSEAYRSLLKREKNGCPVHLASLKPLVVSDRQQFVRHYLKQHGKALDESPFNNQMLQLVTKLDSGNPLYLQIACDYLKTFAVFESLMQKLQTFPPTLNQVLEEIINQTEKIHGANIVQSALSMMCIVKEGLDEKEMHVLLSVAKPELFSNSPPPFLELVEEIKSLKLDNMIPPVAFYSLVHLLKTFAYPFGKLSHGSLQLASKEFSSVVAKHYSKNNYAQTLLYFHRLLAAYYYTMCNRKYFEDWSGSSNTAFHGLLYHLLCGKCYAELAKFLCCHKFLRGAYNVNAGEELPEYYEVLLSGDIIKSVAIKKEKIEDYANFINQNMHVLKAWPFLIQQQAINEPAESSVFKECADPNVGRWILQRLSQSSESLNFCYKTLDGFSKNIICVKVHDFHPVAAMGSEDGSAKIFNLGTGKILSSLRGHSSSITSICFLGKDKICLSSADNTLSIWSCSEHYRIAVLEGHTRLISSCCCDPQGNIVSAGWDCTVRFWSSQDGRQISCIDNMRCPVNSVAHHPEQQLVACGLWNKTIEIWDAVLLTKKSTLRGHNGSVQSVVYSCSGLYLLSSSICAEAFVWSTNDCLKIAKMDGHTASVNSICCSSRRSYFVTASDDTTLKVWPDEQQVVKLTIKEFKTHPVRFMEIVSPLHLAVAFQNSVLRVFDLVDGHVVTEFDTQSDPVSCFSKFNGRGGQQQNQCADRSVEVLVFGTKSGKAMELKFEDTSITEVACLNSSVTAMLHTECIAFCGTTNGDLAVLPFDNEISHGIQYSAHKNSVTALSVSSTGMHGFMLSVSADEQVKFWEFGGVDGKEDLSPKLIDIYLSKHKDYMTSCCIYQSSSEKHIMLTGSYDNTVVIWDDEKELVLTKLKTSIAGIYYSGKYIIACGSEGSIAVWNQKGNCISYIPGIEKSSAVIAFDFHKEKMSIKDFDATLAFVENDGSISIRKPFQRSSVCTLQGHGSRVTSCDINRNDVVLSCSTDKTVNVWKIPKVISENSTLYHTGRINTVALSDSGELVFSGDEHGNLILWRINVPQEKRRMKYITQKKYTGGNIAAVLWMQKNMAVCSAQIKSKSEEKYFIEILNCKSSSELDSSFSIQVQLLKYFSSEITSLDCLQRTDPVVVVGLKSGHVFLMNSQVQKEVKIADDWIVKTRLFSAADPILYVAETSGIVKCFSFSELCNSQVEPKFTIKQYEDDDKVWITTLNYDMQNTLYSGDTSGRISAYSSNGVLTKQAHTSAVTDMCFAHNFLLTCSLDRTVKVWNPVDLKQVGQFHSQSPISCLAVPGGKWIPNTPALLDVIFGTTVGDVHWLRLFGTAVSGVHWLKSLESAGTTTIFGGPNVDNSVKSTLEQPTGFGMGSPFGSPKAMSSSSTVLGSPKAIGSSSIVLDSPKAIGSSNVAHSATLFGGVNITAVAADLQQVNAPV